MHQAPSQYHSSFQWIRCLIENNLITDIDRVAGKVSGISRIDNDAFMRRNSTLNRHA